MKNPRLEIRRKGNALIVTLVTLSIIAGFVALAISLTAGVSRNVQRSMVLRQATAIGDAAIEMAFANWRDKCISMSTDSAPPTGSNFAFISTSAPKATDFAGSGAPSYTLTNYKVVAANTSWDPIGGSTAVPRSFGASDSDYSYFYLASADVMMPTLASRDPTNPADPGNVTARVRRVFEIAKHPITNGMAWFKDDLEIHPGAEMEINGDVHTNGALYTGHNTLTLAGNTSFGDTWSVGFKPGDNTHPETPTMPTWADGRPVRQDQVQMPYGVDIPNYHKLIENTLSPPADPTDPLKSTDAIYADNFSNPANSSVQIYISDNPDPSKPDIVTIYAGGDKITSGNLYNAVQDAVTTTTSSQTITDYREGATTGNGKIRLTTVDVGDLTNSINDNDLNYKSKAFNGVLYISDISADPKGVGAKRGIRLKNGDVLPNGGLTIASDNPVYIQGDYNTGSISPPSNFADPDPSKLPDPPPSPEGPGYDRKPAAVIADAVTILSNAWDDSRSTQSINNRKATPTTVNAAIVSGIVPTGNGYYSGGLENFPRFLENWNNVVFTYYGSMLELYSSKQGVGIWGKGGGNVYSPPTRYWYFDSNFLTDPPPGIPYTIDYRRSRWYME